LYKYISSIILRLYTNIGPLIRLKKIVDRYKEQEQHKILDKKKKMKSHVWYVKQMNLVTLWFRSNKGTLKLWTTLLMILSIAPNSWVNISRWSLPTNHSNLQLTKKKGEIKIVDNIVDDIINCYKWHFNPCALVQRPDILKQYRRIKSPSIKWKPKDLENVVFHCLQTDKRRKLNVVTFN